MATGSGQVINIHRWAARFKMAPLFYGEVT